MLADILIVSVVSLLKIGAVIAGLLTVVAYGSYAERRVSAIIQDRLGPNRVGPYGLLQPLADGIKFMWKEDFIPRSADRTLFVLAPIMILVPSLMAFAVIPFGNILTIPEFSFFGVFTVPQITTALQIIDLNVGILYILGTTSIAVYGIAIGGFSANNKWSLLGGVRASAQMVSYELSLGLSLVGVLMITGSLQMSQIVGSQTEGALGGLLTWNIFRQPLGFLIFVVAAFAENNRLPFDMVEAEQELVGGYHTEYSSMKFSMFMIAEYANMTTASALMATLFFGGWHIPFLSGSDINPLLLSILEVGAFIGKTLIFVFIYIWVRWSLPRFRYDQLMAIGWKVLLPFALINVVLTAVVMLVF
jgi:NADH-quinone oxidoreductase subunit H